MSTGTVKFFNTTKWFGFITPDDWSKDMFVHTSQIQWGVLNEGDKVQYTEGEWPKGPNAENVSRVE